MDLELGAYPVDKFYEFWEKEGPAILLKNHLTCRNTIKITYYSFLSTG
jgi:hypothetical protein